MIIKLICVGLRLSEVGIPNGTLAIAITPDYSTIVIWQCINCINLYLIF
ncbi:hypothetical protein LC613_03695 [Nostoc sphaeroides CHAB 2801]|nr:hypothetical protein [Nostoc sphaeroides]MCC5627313.1 hypothetical protein [Nostoc sphaeroides CHAB 2801]